MINGRDGAIDHKAARKTNVSLRQQKQECLRKNSTDILGESDATAHGKCLV